MQALPSKVGSGPATGSLQLDGRTLHFPQLEYIHTHRGHPAVQAAMQKWIIVTTLLVFFGHTTPHRADDFCSWSHPDHIPAKCPEAHCTAKECRGNLFRRAADGKSYTMVCPHTKTGKHIQYPMPSTTFIWLDVYWTWIWPVWAKPGVTKAFITPATGVAISTSNLTRLFEASHACLWPEMCIEMATPN